MLQMITSQNQSQRSPMTTSVRLDSATRELLTEATKREDRSQSQVIRRAIKEYAEKKGDPQ